MKNAWPASKISSGMGWKSGPYPPLNKRRKWTNESWWRCCITALTVVITTTVKNRWRRCETNGRCSRCCRRCLSSSKESPRLKVTRFKRCLARRITPLLRAKTRRSLDLTHPTRMVKRTRRKMRPKMAQRTATLTPKIKLYQLHKMSLSVKITKVWLKESSQRCSLSQGTCISKWQG